MPTFDELLLEIQTDPNGHYRARLSIPAQAYNPGWATCDASLWNRAAGRPEWLGSYNRQADGARIFTWLTRDPTLAAAWSQAATLAPQRRIRLDLDAGAPELAGVPWELLFNPAPGGGWVAGASASPFSRLLLGGFDPAGPVHERPLRILVAAANPLELPDGLAPVDAAAFWERMTAAAQDLVEAGQVELQQLPQPVTLESLEAELRKGYHVLSLAAHGQYQFDKNRAAIFIHHAAAQKDYVLADEFAAMIARGIQNVQNLGRPFLRLVTLLSCQSATSGLLNTFSSAAQQLGQQGLPAVLAMQDLVGVNAAFEFITVFYRQLLAHGLVDLAANEARQALLTAQSGDAHVPVIFSRLKNNQLLEPVPYRPPKARLPYEPEMVLIPAGRFYLGAAPQDLQAAEWENPGAWRDDLPAFWIGKYPVTNQEYAEFIQQSDHPAPRLNWDGRQPEAGKLRHPVAGVTWKDAHAYCEWLSAQTGRRYHLPSEAQWEKAARGGQDARIYPWGDAWEANRCHAIPPDPNQPETRPEFFTVPVDQYPPQSPTGCYDLIGNLREWTTTLWGDRLAPEQSAFPYPWQADEREQAETAGRYFKAYRIYRGGGAGDDPAQMRCSARDWDDLSATYMCGFRVARER